MYVVKCEDFLELHSDFVQNKSIQYETVMSELETLMAKQTAVITATKWWRGICMVFLKWTHHDLGADRYSKLSWDIRTYACWLKFVVNEHSFDRVVNNLLGI